MRKRSKEFVAGQGYTKEDWDAVESPELTDDEIASLRPAREVLPPELFEALTNRKPGQRGRRKRRRKRSYPSGSTRTFSNASRRTGPGWQSRINDALRKAIDGAHT